MTNSYQPLVIGLRVKMRHAGHLGVIEAFSVNGWPIVRWDSGLTTRAEPHELVALERPTFTEC